jgi:hypothetical protein
MIAAKAIKASATATFHSLSIERHRLSMQHLYQHGQCLEVGVSGPSLLPLESCWSPFENASIVHRGSTSQYC